MKRIVLSLVGILAVLVITAGLSGCYIAKQGYYFYTYQQQAEPITEVLENDELSSEIRSLLENAVEIKQFSTEQLGLNKDRNYTKYIPTDRNFLVYVVSGCKKDRFEPYKWSFPFLGSLPYKGFYKEEDAQKEAQKLREKNYDVIIRKVGAFSTLGFFSDPVYSFMEKYSLYIFANIIIHEQTHATIFLKDQVQFNEELATFVGNEGALEFIREKEGEDSQLIEEALLQLEDTKNFYNLIRILYRQLEEYYDRAIEEELDYETVFSEKKKIIEEFSNEVKEHYELYFETDKFKRAFDIPVNNAYILSFVRYTKDLSLFYDLYRKYDYDLAKTIEAIKPVIQKQYREKPKKYIRSLLTGE